MRCFDLLLHPELPVHVFNVLFLMGVIPFWLVTRPSYLISGAQSTFQSFYNHLHFMVTRGAELFDAFGDASGIACKIMLGMCLLPIARRSVWLDAAAAGKSQTINPKSITASLTVGAAAGFAEGIALHRVTGWWCVVQVVIHWIAYTLKDVYGSMRARAASCLTSARYRTLYYYNSWVSKNATKPSSSTPGPQFVGGFQASPQRVAFKALEVYYLPGVTRLQPNNGREEPNNRGILVLVGVIGLICAVTLAVFALPRLRRARYDLFYLVHLPSAALFIFLGAVHDYSIQLFVIPGLVTYVLDRTHRLTWPDFLNFRKTSSYQRVLAHMRVMGEDLIGVDLVDTRNIATTEAAYGTQFLYLRVPVLGPNSHPFSLAARCPSFVIKCSGDWTRRLHALAVKQAADALTSAPGGEVIDADDIPLEQLTKVTTKIVCEIDGVYGCSSPPWRGYSHVMFIGGGVGVTPWLAAMEEHLELCRVQDPVEQSMKLVWIGRDFNDLQALGAYLPRANTTAFLTRLAKKSFRSRDSASAELQPPHPIAKQAHQQPVRIEASRPWSSAVAVIVSLFLSQILYHFIRGDGSYYATLKGPEISQARYFWTKVAAVGASFAAIAFTATAVRWLSTAHIFARCPCISGAAANDAGAIHHMSNLSFSEQQSAAATGLSVKLERPDMELLIEEGVADVDASHAKSQMLVKGLFVCVCGPLSLVNSCSDAVKKIRKRHARVPVGLHVEQPEW
jgi:hypothetical protein